MNRTTINRNIYPTLRGWHTACLALGVAAFLFVACSTNDDALESTGTAELTTPATIDFNAYLRRQTTRSGVPGTLTTTGADGTVSLQEVGFGVLGYNTGERWYLQTDVPNFMYNEHVTYNAERQRWTYEPAKYWPNGEGEAVGVAGVVPHYVSFFAYAPRVAIDPVTGMVQDDGHSYFHPRQGITALTRHAKTGDPYVRYDMPMDPAQRVDLCWALPHMNRTKPTAASRAVDLPTVDLEFYHALTAMNMRIDTDILQEQNPEEKDGPGRPDGFTRVWVRSVTVEGFTNRGWLALNNPQTRPVWYTIDGYLSGQTIALTPLTIHDGRRDWREALHADPNELVTGLNPRIVQQHPYTIADDGTIAIPAADGDNPGVTETTVNLFGTDDGTTALGLPVYGIPTGGNLRVTIVYDVETYDPKLVSDFLADGRTPGSRIRNNITAAVTMNGSPVSPQAGSVYCLKLHLGLRSVEAEAFVTRQWEEGFVEVIDNFEESNDQTQLGVSIIDNFAEGPSIDGEIELP